MIEVINGDKLLKAFEFAPAIIALLVVIYLQYKQLRAKDQTIEKMVDISEFDTNHHSKVLTLLEVLVNNRGK
jgi:hypothetical protein